MLGVDQVRLVGALGEHTPPFPRMRQRPDEEMRGPAVTVPPGGWVGQIDPVPLGFLPSGVVDDRDRPAGRRVARLARRAEPADPKVVREPWVGPVVAQRGDLVEQRGRPQMRVLFQPQLAVRGERPEDVLTGRCADTGGPLAGQVRPDRLAVLAQMPGNR